MKLLICTQAVDLDDPVLGFFHRWIGEFSQRCDAVHVICLKEGRHDLPKNVFVHSLGKESARSRIKYVFNFYRYAWKFRREYDAVFVHMNQEYVLLGAPLWKLWGKQMTMWRNHYAGSFLTNIAVAWCDKVFCTSKRSYTAKFKKTILMPIGIDTELFKPAAAPKPDSILFLGRLDAPKRADVFIRALELLHERGVHFSADIIGDPSEPHSKYAHDVRNQAAELALEGIVTMRPGVPNEEAAKLFREHAVFCNLAPSGSFDKTIGEAMASGCLVVALNDAVRDIIPEALQTDETPEVVAKALEAALRLPEVERQEIVAKQRAYIEHKHSLSLLANKLIAMLSV